MPLSISARRIVAMGIVLLVIGGMDSTCRQYGELCDLISFAAGVMLVMELTPHIYRVIEL